MQVLANDEKNELLQLAIDKASDHVDDLYTKVYEYLEDITGLDWIIPDDELHSIALEACRQVEKKQAAAVERSENDA